MDCPTCGLANPPEATRCDCGYDFSASQPSDLPGWPADLAWGHKVAAFWSISWPALIGAFLPIVLFSGNASIEILQRRIPLLTVVSNVLYFGFQALITRRLVRKNYRSFRVYVVRPGGTRSRTLSLRETVVVWLWIFWPQFLFFIAASLVVWLVRSSLSPETVRGLNSLAILFRYLFVGPYAVDLALRIDHSNFRLQTYAIRYV